MTEKQLKEIIRRLDDIEAECRAVEVKITEIRLELQRTLRK